MNVKTKRRKFIKRNNHHKPKKPINPYTDSYLIASNSNINNQPNDIIKILAHCLYCGKINEFKISRTFLNSHKYHTIKTKCEACRNIIEFKIIEINNSYYELSSYTCPVYFIKHLKNNKTEVNNNLLKNFEIDDSESLEPI